MRLPLSTVKVEEGLHSSSLADDEQVCAAEKRTCGSTTDASVEVKSDALEFQPDTT